ncbi:MAG TPA: FtsX-like permease family protein, partial [Longimicrobiales bacterium]|nr:FtsX-like permease family protein [Longimicrobiales bacterium]
AVMAYTVTRKTRELGIRLALGARAAELERAELLRGVKLALLGLVIGAIGAAWLARFIAAFLYGVGTVDPVTYGAVALLVVIVVLAASYLPARRAAMIDPMESLRTE